jgi:histone H1/5
MRNPAQEVINKAKPSKISGKFKEKIAAKRANTPKSTTFKEKITASIAAKKAKETPAPAKPAPAPAKPAPAPAAETPAMQKKKMVSKKTAYNIKEASNPKLSASARKHYAMNAQAAMKNKKKK